MYVGAAMTYVKRRLKKKGRKQGSSRWSLLLRLGLCSFWDVESAIRSSFAIR